MNNLIVVSPRDIVPEGFTVINTTSKDDKNIGKQLSPFFLGPVVLYEHKIALNMENAWQFSKVYKEYTDENNKPTADYFLWAKIGWKDKFAHRYPYGKGAIPQYSYWKIKEGSEWKEMFWGYIEARKKIYFPLYAKAIIETNAYKELQTRLEKGECLALWDFDGYDHAKRGMTFEDVVHNEKYKCGHAFVLYGLLTKQLVIKDNELFYEFK